MGKFKDITNQRFGLLTAKNIAYRKNNASYWNCDCECGNKKIVLLGNLSSGKTKSCGCLQKNNGKIFKKYNPYTIKDNIVIFKTFNTNNEFFIDLEDLEKVKDICWFENNSGYICNKSNKIIQLHRLVTNCPKNLVVDHLDHNPLNNCKNNLRVCSQRENMQNIKINNNNLLKEYGICKAYRKNRTYYIVNLNGYNGCYKNIDDAKKKRDIILEKRKKEILGKSYL